MEDRVLAKKAYSLLFLVLAVWSAIPYVLSDGHSLLVFNKINVSFEVIFIIISLIASHGTFYNKKHGYFAGITSIILTILYLGSLQVLLQGTNVLQLATLVTMLLILAIFGTAFKASPAIKRKRLNTKEFNLQART